MIEITRSLARPLKTIWRLVPGGAGVGWRRMLTFGRALLELLGSTTLGIPIEVIVLLANEVRVRR